DTGPGDAPDAAPAAVRRRHAQRAGAVRLAARREQIEAGARHPQDHARAVRDLQLAVHDVARSRVQPRPGRHDRERRRLILETAARRRCLADMRLAPVAAVALAACHVYDPIDEVEFREYADTTTAIQTILGEVPAPRVYAVGEYHMTRRTVAKTSPLARF